MLLPAPDFAIWGCPMNKKRLTWSKSSINPVCWFSLNGEWEILHNVTLKSWTTYRSGSGFPLWWNIFNILYLPNCIDGRVSLRCFADILKHQKSNSGKLGGMTIENTCWLSLVSTAQIRKYFSVIVHRPYWTWSIHQTPLAKYFHLDQPLSQEANI